MMKIILASASSRRSALLDQLQIAHSVHPVDLDEAVLPQESGRDYVLRLAGDKARAAAALSPSNAIIIAADTTILLDEQIIGKPKDQDDMIRTFSQMSGRTHKVLTGVCVRSKKNEQIRCVDTTVKFREVSIEEIISYWNTGEPADKAGGYAIQGLGALFVESLSGSYSSVVGLPLMEVSAMLTAVGYSVLDIKNK